MKTAAEYRLFLAAWTLSVADGWTLSVAEGLLRTIVVSFRTERSAVRNLVRPLAAYTLPLDKLGSRGAEE